MTEPTTSQPAETSYVWVVEYFIHGLGKIERYQFVGKTKGGVRVRLYGHEKVILRANHRYFFYSQDSFLKACRSWKEVELKRAQSDVEELTSNLRQDDLGIEVWDRPAERLSVGKKSIKERRG